jgi:sulfite exporter TauE/SafE
MYTLAGVICGFAGAVVDFGGTRVGLHRAAAVLAGGMMIGAGIVAVLRYGGVRLPELPLAGAIQRPIARAQRAVLAFGPGSRALAMGLLTAFLPCGWLYVFAVFAAGTGSPSQGAAVMAAFWLGSVPTLVSVGIGVQAFAGTLGSRIPLITAVAIVLLGVLTIVMRVSLPVAAFGQAARVPASGSVEAQVESVRSATPPCCERHGD